MGLYLCIKPPALAGASYVCQFQKSNTKKKIILLLRTVLDSKKINICQIQSRKTRVLQRKFPDVDTRREKNRKKTGNVGKYEENFPKIVHFSRHYPTFPGSVHAWKNLFRRVLLKFNFVLVILVKIWKFRYSQALKEIKKRIYRTLIENSLSTQMGCITARKFP